MHTLCDSMRVSSTGELVVVTFVADGLDELDVRECQAAIEELLRQQRPARLAFDLSGIWHVPSSVLSLFLWCRQQGVEVWLCNPSDAVRDVLRVTHLAQFFTLRDLPCFDDSPAIQWLAGLETVEDAKFQEMNDGE